MPGLFTGEDAVDHTLGIAAPAQDDDQVFLRFDEDNIAARPSCGKAFDTGQVGHCVLVVEPPQQAVFGVEVAGLQGAAYPGFW